MFWDAGANDRLISGSASADAIKGKWNHWVFTKDAAAGSLKIHLNGGLFASELAGNTETLSGITQAWFGGSGGLGNASYEGLLDEVSLYDVALMDAQVAALYCSYDLPEGYQAWLLSYPGLSDGTFEGDPDEDGIANGIEYAFNGTPTSADQMLLPEVTEVGANYVFTVNRRADAVSFTSQCLQYGSDLTNWTDLKITEPRASEVSLGAILEVQQEVTVTIPKNVAVDGEIFWRLKVELR